MKIYEIVYLVLLFIIGTLLWTLPIQKDNLPFGEGDAAWHFANGDWATKQNHVFWKLPFYISTWYYNYNKIIGPGALEYPPGYHLGYSIFQVFGGHRFIAPYILIAIGSFIGAFSVYLLLRKLYDFPTAMVASTAMVFSFREILVYLWGQRPTILSFAFVPLILYAYYKYVEQVYSGNKSPVYLYLTGVLLTLQFLVHPQGLLLSLTAIIFYTLAQLIKTKKLPFTKSMLGHYGIILILISFITIPFINIYLGAESGVQSKIEFKDMGRLFDWMEIKDREGYPNSMGGPPVVFYEMDKVFFPFYFIAVVGGVLFLFIRRQDRDVLILCWLAALYLMIHLDVFGVMGFGRLSRMLMGETALFYSIISIGIFGTASLFIKKEYGSAPIKIIASFLLAGLVLYNGFTAYGMLKEAYKYPLRISQEQYLTAQWIDLNLPQDAYLYFVGTLTYPKQRFFYILSHRPSVWQNDKVDYPWMNITHVLIDYSDAVRTNNQQLIEYLGKYEQQYISSNMTKVYDQYNIKIYQLGGAKIE